MESKKVLLLGASGMLGSMLLSVLSKDKSIELTATVRGKNVMQSCMRTIKDINWNVLNAQDINEDGMKAIINNNIWIINAIGTIKPYIHDDNPKEIFEAIRVNSVFPYILGNAASNTNSDVIQIATDCVFSGMRGSYTETDPHDPLDVYGKSKSLGEVFLPNFYNLRCSIIGPESKSYLSLMEWLLKQLKNAEINGYINHQWNGITTLHFSRLCLGIIHKDIKTPHLQHIVPKGVVSKFDLLKEISILNTRTDIKINPSEAKLVINRTLSTNNEKLNRELWMAAGYNEIPSINKMLSELAEYKYEMGGLSP